MTEVSPSEPSVPLTRKQAREMGLFEAESSTPSRTASRKQKSKHAGKREPKGVRPKAGTKRKKTKMDYALALLAETLIVAGVLGGMFVFWKFYLNDAISDSNQSSAANELIQKFSDTTGIDSLDYDPLSPPEEIEPGYGENIGVIYIPRLDPNYKRVIAQGTTPHVLDNRNAGVGHYEGTAMPGGIGNFSLAGHRGTVFKNLKSLVPGDRIYIQTSQGYYTYQMEQEHTIVLPEAIEVIAPVPGQPDAKPTERLITLTTCWPEWSNTERLIVHAKFVEWRPTAAGPPSEIASAAAQ